MMKNYLLLTALFNDPAVINELYKAVIDCRCNVHESRMTAFQSEYTATLSLSGSWDAIAKIENVLNQLANKRQLTVIFNRSQPREYAGEFLSYSVQVITADKPGILYKVVHFFIEQGITLHEVYSSTYETTLTKTTMGMINLVVLIPVTHALSQLRENFMVFCDSINVDAVIEPDKL